ncbi:MAG TPA: beta-mannanase, partial [Micromonosporaceae bacterium]
LSSGVYDATLKRAADAMRDMGGPILLRFRWEMDRPNLAAVIHSPAAYIAAWKHVRAIFTAAHATNVAFVWCPLATGFATGAAQQYYPGDDQVDWLCADVYPGDAMTSFSQLMAPVMQFAAQHKRPLVIGEFGVEPQPNNARANWFTAMAADIKQQPQIKAVVYFSANKRSKPFRNYTLGAQPADLAAFKAFANDPYFQSPVDGRSTGG